MNHSPDTSPRPRRRLIGWLLLLGIIAGHGVILYFASSHLALPAAAVTAVVVLVLFRHLRGRRNG